MRARAGLRCRSLGQRPLGDPMKPSVPDTRPCRIPPLPTSAPPSPVPMAVCTPGNLRGCPHTAPSWDSRTLYLSGTIYPLRLPACPALARERPVLRSCVPSIRAPSLAHRRCSVWKEGVPTEVLATPAVCALRGESAWLGTGSAGWGRREGGVPYFR